jgi:hypothetical protein
VGELTCGEAETAPVDVTWATEGATGIAIAVVDFTAVRLGALGTRVMLVTCDDNHPGRSDEGVGNGKVVSTEGSFEAGVDGAQPRIVSSPSRRPGCATGKSTTPVTPRTGQKYSA